MTLHLNIKSSRPPVVIFFLVLSFHSHVKIYEIPSQVLRLLSGFNYSPFIASFLRQPFFLNQPTPCCAFFEPSRRHRIHRAAKVQSIPTIRNTCIVIISSVYWPSSRLWVHAAHSACQFSLKSVFFFIIAAGLVILKDHNQTAMQTPVPDLHPNSYFPSC